MSYFEIIQACSKIGVGGYFICDIGSKKEVIGKIGFQDGMYFLCHNVPEIKGFACLDRKGFKYSVVAYPNIGQDTKFAIQNLRSYKNICKETLKVGDILVDGEGETVKVLEIFDNCFVESDCDDFDEAGFLTTFAQAEKEGYKFYDQKSAFKKRIEDVWNYGSNVEEPTEAELEKEIAVRLKRVSEQLPGFPQGLALKKEMKEFAKWVFVSIRKSDSPFSSADYKRCHEDSYKKAKELGIFK